MSFPNQSLHRIFGHPLIYPPTSLTPSILTSINLILFSLAPLLQIEYHFTTLRWHFLAAAFSVQPSPLTHDMAHFS